MTYTNQKLVLMLQQYFTDVVAVTPDECTVKGWSMPKIWEELLSEDRLSKRDAAISIWKDFCGQVLPKFIAALDELLADVLLVRVSETLKLVHSFEVQQEVFLYVGGNPLDRDVRSDIQESFATLPSEFARFYDEFLNGFVFLPAMSLGPLPVERMFYLGEEDWAWIDDSGFETLPEMDRTLVVFSNGGGGYICLEPANTEPSNPQCLIWWSDEPPDTSSFWPALDSWMEIGLRE